MSGELYVVLRSRCSLSSSPPVSTTSRASLSAPSFSSPRAPAANPDHTPARPCRPVHTQQTTRPLDVATYQPRLLPRLQDSVLLHLQVGGTTRRPHRTELETGGWAAQCWPTSNGAARPVRRHHGQDVEEWWSWETAWEPDGDVSRSRDGLYHLSAPGSRYPRRLHRVRVRQRVVECDPAGYDVTWRHCDMTWRDVTWQWHDITWFDVTWQRWRDVVECGPAKYDMLWHDVTSWHDVTWYYVAWHGVT